MTKTLTDDCWLRQLGNELCLGDVAAATGSVPQNGQSSDVVLSMSRLRMSPRQSVSRLLSASGAS